MKKIILSFSTLLVFFSQRVSGQSVCPIIPLPNEYQQVNETFILNNETPVIAKDPSFKQSAYVFSNLLLSCKGITVSPKRNGHAPIILQKASALKNMREGAYHIDMNAEKVVISAADDDGIFNGLMSLLQLARLTGEKDNSLSIRCWNIKDAPLYAWRGLMLDESRHFFGKEVVEKILNQMALLKLNRFHWHLTDKPGWRIQIKKYPKLALVGGIGNHSDSTAPAKYYTQADIREIVAYAKERHIKVIPEVDMPGHATAANRAYPQFGGGGKGKYADFTFNPGKAGTYRYLTDILREVSVLFPSRMIHLGGDEVSFGSKSWAKDTGVQHLMAKEHLADLKAVEHYFFRRMDDSALQIYRKVLAWDEAADATLPPDSTIIFWWRQNKPEQLDEALEKGYEVVLCPRIPLYFDFVQDSTHRQGRRWKGSFSSLDKVYAFSDRQFPEAVKKNKLVLGIQANLWTETVQTKKRLEFLLFPRIAALSEAAWTKPDKRNYEQFLSRLKPRLSLYRKEDIYYYDPFSPEKTPEIIDGY